MDKVVHFEIPFENKERAFKFYSNIFGWKINEIPGMDYAIIHAAETNKDNMVTEKGAINGGMFQRSVEASSPVVVIAVDSIDATIAKIKISGGKVVTPKQPIPNGSYARVADSEGNVVGIVDMTK
jgi:predicted enzyme related to lactoylglutathione lyase